ncbi:MAG TPA: hypothetical protein ENI32_03940 [Candidatus Syntrophoarchaeum butanivorans]|uniref:Uncharacterized protein n=1 Tax=Candidatus Syntropharchaeum butanivorans TaxID=1839936 RepID=A0A7J2S2S7_9EURY|nr:hypothetical protein [Candidatus Syntrophoarchaeum butanivorans]
MEEDEGWIRDVLLDAWDVVVDGVASERKQMLQPPRGGEGKWKIESRTKIKSLTEGLSEFEDAGGAVLHFVKYAEYYLPRSDLNSTLEKILEKVSDIRKRTDGNPEQMRRQIEHLIGYIAWSLDGFVNILNNCGDDEKAIRENLDRMLTAELSLAGAGDQKDDIVNKLVEWWKNPGRGR